MKEFRIPAVLFHRLDRFDQFLCPEPVFAGDDILVSSDRFLWSVLAKVESSAPIRITPMGLVTVLAGAGPGVTLNLIQSNAILRQCGMTMKTIPKGIDAWLCVLNEKKISRSVFGDQSEEGDEFDAAFKAVEFEFGIPPEEFISSKKYSVSKIRFKVWHALHRAGLHESQIAKRFFRTKSSIRGGIEIYEANKNTKDHQNQNQECLIQAFQRIKDLRYTPKAISFRTPKVRSVRKRVFRKARRRPSYKGANSLPAV